MSDQDTPPPKPKPGSLRDRIAAFENKPAAAPVPAPRPKPGNVQWKPKTVSPPSSPPQGDSSGGSTIDRRVVGASGMSAADAKATIGVGGSLKERMAALQGKAAFGAPSPPPPKPASDKPKWKPPVAPVPTIEPTEQIAGIISETEIKEPEDKVEKLTTEEVIDKTVETVEENVEHDSEDEERQRRANIAARMARLGGARIGMAPPVTAKKPQPKTSHETEELVSPTQPSKSLSTEHDARSPPSRSGSIKSQTSGGGQVTSPSSQFISPGSTETEKKEYFDTSATSSEPTSVTSSRSPTSMPVPAVPRRAGPPRKKIPKAPSPSITPAPTIVPEDDKESVEVPADTTAVEAIAPLDVPRDLDAVETPPTIPDVAHHGVDPSVNVDEDTQEQIESHEAVAKDLDTTLHKDEHMEDEEEDEEDIPKIDESERVPAATIVHEEPEEEEDDTARRKRIAERIAKSGAGMNPFSLPPQPVRRSSSMVPEIPSTTTEVRSIGSRQGSIDESVVKPSRQSSTFSVNSANDRSAVQRGSLDSTSQSKPAPSIMDREEEEIDESNEADKENDDQALSSGFNSSAIKEPLKYEMKPEEEARDTTYSHGYSNIVARGDHEIEANDTYRSNVLNAMDTRKIENISSADQMENEDDASVQEAYEEVEDDTVHEYTQIAVPSDDHEIEDDLTPSQIATSIPSVAYTQPITVASPIETSLRRTVPPPRPLPDPIPSHEVLISSQHSPVTSTGIPPDAPLRRDTRRSMPPPPRPLPVPTHISHNEDEDSAELEPSHPPPPSRRSMPPPPVPSAEVDDEDDDPPPSSEDDDAYTDAHATNEGSDDIYLETEEAPTPVRRFYGNDATSQIPAVPLPNITRRSMPPPSRAPPTEPRTSDVEAYSIDFHGNATELNADIKVDDNSEPQHEVLDEADGDPIDPVIYRPPSRLPTPSPPHSSNPTPILERAPQVTPEVEPPEDGGLKRQTIAERMAKLGGIKFGVPSPALRPQRPSPPPTEEESSEEVATTAQTEEQILTDEPENEEEEERARKERIATKLAGMGGLRFGMIPNIQSPVSPQHPPMKSDDRSSKTASTIIPPAPPVPSQRTAVLDEDAGKTTLSSSLPRPPVPLQRPSPPVMKGEIEKDESLDMADSEMVNVDTEESEMEEVNYEDAHEELPPQVPTRVGRRQTSDPHSQELPPPLPTGRPAAQRPVVPVIPPIRRESRPSFAANEQRASGVPTPSQGPPQSDFVIVDDPILEHEEIPPPPPPRTSRGATSSRQASDSSRPSIRSQSEVSNQGQWGLPEIPSASLHLTQGDDLSSSAWSEDSTTYPTTSDVLEHNQSRQGLPPARSASSSVQQSASVRPEIQLSSEELLALWGRVGVHISAVAHHMHEKSKKTLIGDGTYPGFIRAVLNQVQGAAPLSPNTHNYGHLIYAQSGNTVQWRAGEIMPGDVIMLNDAKLKGHKGLQSYQQNVGIGEPLVGIISDFEPKKSKAKVYQANQHVGGSTVETISYRFEDMKSGVLKVFRVAEA